MHPLTRYHLATARMHDLAAQAARPAPSRWKALLERIARLSPTAAG